MIYHRNDQAYWLDQLEPVEGTHTRRFAEESLMEVGAGPE